MFLAEVLGNIFLKMFTIKKISENLADPEIHVKPR
jgi:hypothetical protein